MTAMRPPVPLSVPRAAAGLDTPTPAAGTGVSDVSVGVAGNTSAFDAGKDASMKNGVVTAEGPGTGEQHASVSSNGQTTGTTAEAPPPSNHVATAKQIKDYQKAQLKLQQKALKDAKKKGAVPAVAAPAAATPAATPAATSTPQ